MSAVTHTVTVEERLVTVAPTVTNGRLTQALLELSKNAAANGRILYSLRKAVEELSGTSASEFADLKDQLAAEVQQRKALEAEVAQQKKRFAELEALVARKSDVDHSVQELRGSLKKATDFIEEVEKGSGARVTKFVTQYIESFIPKWYEGVSTALMKEITAMVDAVSDNAAASLESRAQQCEQKSIVELNSAQTHIMNSVYALNDDRRKELSKFRQETADRFVESDHRTDLICDQIKGVESKRHLSTRLRLRSVEESIAALQTTLCLDDGLCRELHNLTVTHYLASDQDDPRHARLHVSSELVLVPDDKQADMGFPGDHRRLHAPELFPKIGVDDSIADLRVRRVAQTPHLIGLRGTLQRESSERIDFLKTDLHNDLVGEIFDLQREIRGKVGTNKLGELLDQYRDESLYTNVKLLMQDMADVKSTKVDTVLFVEGLRAKADLRAMELKADKVVLSQQVDVLERRLADVAAAAARSETRLTRVESNVARRGTVTGLPPSSAPTERRGTQGDIAGLLEDRRPSPPKSAGKLVKGRRLSSPPVGSSGGIASPFTPFSTGGGDEESDFDGRRGIYGHRPSTTKAQSSTKAISELVDQIVESGFPQHVVVQDSRELSKHQQNLVKSLHEKEVTSMAARADDPNVEERHQHHHDGIVSIELPKLEMRLASAPSALSSSSKRGAHQQPQEHGSSPKPPRRAPEAPQSSSVSRVAAATTSSRPHRSTMVPLTTSQEAYCRAVDASPLPSPGKGYAVGLPLGERRDY